MKGRRTLELAAAVALLAACSAESPAAESAEPTSTSVVSPSPEPSLAGCAPACLEPNLTIPGELPAGEYETVYFFGGLMTLTLGSPMTSGEDSTGEFHLTPDEPGPAARDILFWQDVYPWQESDGTPAEIPSAAELVESLTTNPDFVTSEPVEGAIGALPATVFDLTLSDTASGGDPECPEAVCVNVVDYPQWDFPYAITPSFAMRWYVADVGYGGQTHTLVVALAAIGIDDLESLLPIAESLLESVRLPATAAQ